MGEAHREDGREAGLVEDELRADHGAYPVPALAPPTIEQVTGFKMQADRRKREASQIPSKEKRVRASSGEGRSGGRAGYGD